MKYKNSCSFCSQFFSLEEKGIKYSYSKFMDDDKIDSSIYCTSCSELLPDVNEVSKINISHREEYSFYLTIFSYEPIEDNRIRTIFKIY